MKQYLLSIYQPDSDPPPANVLAEICAMDVRVDEERPAGRGCSQAAFTRHGKSAHRSSRRTDFKRDRPRPG